MENNSNVLGSRGLTYLIPILTKVVTALIVFIGAAILIVSACFMLYTETVSPETYVLPITDKSMEVMSTRYSIQHIPTLHFLLDEEEITLSVNKESYDNVNVNDLVAVNVWRIKGRTVRTELNPDLNNTKE